MRGVDDWPNGEDPGMRGMRARAAQAEAWVRERKQRAEDAYPHLPCVAVDAAGDRLAAASACEAAGAHRGCEFRDGIMSAAEYVGDGKRWSCPRDRLRGEWNQRVMRVPPGIPDRLRDRVLASHPGRFDEDADRLIPAAPLEDTDALRLARAWVTGSPQAVQLASGTSIDLRGDEWVLVLGGPPGVGKSLAAAWALIEKGGKWLNAAKLESLDLDLAEYGAVEPDPRRVLVDGFAPTMLVLDDLGEEHVGASGWSATRAQHLLCARADANLRTIITTNLFRRGPGQFAERYGARVDDRLNDGVFVGLTGPSLRGRK